MQKIKDISKFKIVLTIIVPILMIGSFYSPIVNSIQNITNSNEENVLVSIDLEKYVWDGSTYQDADTPPGPYLPSTQDPVVFKFTIHNNGDLILTNVTLTDTDITNFYDDEACTDPAEFPTILMINQIKTYYGKLSWAAGQHNNTAIATDACAEISDTDWANYYGISSSIDIEKYVSVDNGNTWYDADTSPGPYALVGNPVKFKVNVTNTGNIELTGISVSDDVYGMVFNTGLQVSLAPGAWDESDVYTTSAVAGQHTNLATVTCNQGVTDNDPANYFGSNPSINITKYVSSNGVNWLDANNPTGPIIPVGSNVYFKVKVTNTGNIELTGISVSDDVYGMVFNTGLQVSLAPGAWDESDVYTTSAVAGQHTNLATVTCNQGVTDNDPANYYGSDSSIDIEKYVSVDNGNTWYDADIPPGPYIISGNPVKFKVNVTNTGTTDLTNIIVTDTDFTFTGVATSLTPGAWDESDIITIIAVCGQQWDNASVIGTPSIGPVVTDYDLAFYNGSCPCQDIVWIDDDFDSNTPNWLITHFAIKQMALDWLHINGTAYVYDGIYNENIIIDSTPCNNTGITQKGEYGCFPIDESAIINGNETIKVNNVTIKYLEYTPNINGSIFIYPNVNGTTIRCNKFNKDCIDDAVGVKSHSTHPVNAELNWWGEPNGPNGGMMDDGKTANGEGVKVIGDNIDVEPWIGIHAEINKPNNPTTVQVGQPIQFDATGSWAYTYGECCQEPEELPLQYLWDFDDGKYSPNKITTHVYYETGTYEVTLTIDSPGIPGLYTNFMFDWAYVTIYVTNEGGTPLTCDADGGNLGGYETMVNEPLQLYGSTYGGNGEYNWHWNFGDQTTDSNLQNPIHTYTQPGTYTVTLTVISGGETATDTAQVTVYDIDELFVNINDANTAAGIETMFTASIHGGTPPYSVEWDFGDETTSQENNPTHIYNNPGTYTMTIIVTDDKQKTATDTAIITVEESTIETSEIKNVKGGLGIQATIIAGENNCPWQITVDGMVFFGGENSGTINANTQQTVKLGFSFAIGRVDINIKVAAMEKQYTAFAFGPIYLNLKET